MRVMLQEVLFVLCILANASGEPFFKNLVVKTAVFVCPKVADKTRHSRNNIPQIDRVFFELRTPCSRTQYRVTEANKMRDSLNFDVNKRTVIFVSGWQSDMNAPYTETMTDSYHCRGDHNFIVVNTGDFIKGLNYFKCAFNTEELGQFVAYGLKKLNIPGSNIHLIGHSLGAHIMGSAGRHFKAETGDRISRITGLDPARPCFVNTPVFSRLSDKDADFVDVIHSNAKEAGTEEPIGHADFYPGGMHSTQPSCDSDDVDCSHAMSIKYYTETVDKGNDDNFEGYQCPMYSSFDVDSCKGNKARMGFAAKPDTKGVYVMDVGDKAPYGRNARSNTGRRTERCGQCSRIYK